MSSGKWQILLKPAGQGNSGGRPETATARAQACAPPAEEAGPPLHSTHGRPPPRRDFSPAWTFSWCLLRASLLFSLFPQLPALHTNLALLGHVSWCCSQLRDRRGRGVGLRRSRDTCPQHTLRVPACVTWASEKKSGSILEPTVLTHEDPGHGRPEMTHCPVTAPGPLRHKPGHRTEGGVADGALETSGRILRTAFRRALENAEGKRKR